MSKSMQRRDTQRLVNQLMSIEDGLYESIVILYFVLFPDDQDVLRVLTENFNKRLEAYNAMLAEGGDTLAGRRNHNEWMRVFTVLAEVQQALKAASDGDPMPLRIALRKHLPAEWRDQADIFEAAKRQRQQAEQRQREAELATAAKEAVKSSHISETVKILWDTERRIVNAIQQLKDDGRTQIGAARHYLKLLTDRNNGVGDPLTEDEQAELFYLAAEKSKGDRSFGKQISEIVNKHGTTRQ